MKIIIDIGHPGHVHLFRQFANIMLAKGHQILFTLRQKEFEIELLRSAGFNYKSFGKHYSSKPGKIWGLFRFNLQLFLTSLKFKPDIFLSHGSIYAAQIAWIIRKPHIAMEDTGNKEQVRLYLPFTPVVITSDVFPLDYGNKQIRLKSHHELAYLHPKYFNPKPTLKERNFKEKRFVLLRFVAWNASHDIGQQGLSLDIKKKLVKSLTKQFNVIISSEKGLPPEFEIYRAQFNPAEIHKIIAKAFFVIGEGTTIAMEAAVLGTPAIYINSLQYNNVKDMESYGLLYSLENEDNILAKVDEIISRIDENSFLEKKNKMLNAKIDLTAFLVWFVEYYPESYRIMKENPDYQLRFK